MLFSIVVPVYHVEKYLSRCVKSLIAQTYENIEIILVDDGGDDKCPEMCDHYAEADKRIKVIHKKNGGLSDARNAGLGIATGDYIIFVDSDDYIESDTCQKLLSFTIENPDIIIGDAVVEGGIDRLKHISESSVLDGKTYLLKALEAGRAPMAAWLNIYNRSFLIKNGLKFKYGILHEDEQFTPRAFLNANRISLSGVKFYHYIIREGSITTKKNKQRNLVDFYTTCEELSRIYVKLKDKKLRDKLLNSLASKYLTLYVTANGYEYGKAFYHKSLVYKNSKLFKTRVQSLIYCISPRLYCKLVTRKRRGNNG